MEDRPLSVRGQRQPMGAEETIPRLAPERSSCMQGEVRNGEKSYV
jgi:hypothetical protein